MDICSISGLYATDQQIYMLLNNGFTCCLTHADQQIVTELWKSSAHAYGPCSALAHFLSFLGWHKIPPCLFLPIHCHRELLIHDKIAVLNGTFGPNNVNPSSSGPGMRSDGKAVSELCLEKDRCRNLRKIFICHAETSGRCHLFIIILFILF